METVSADVTGVLALVERGWSVFPVDSPELDRCAGNAKDHDPATCTERGKHPCVSWKSKASTDVQDVAAWFTGHPRNVGIACGPSGLLVIDEDVPGGLEKYASEVGATVPDTFTVSTGRGQHFYFAADGHDLGNVTFLKEYGADVRGRGGYVVGPGSMHATGVLYTVTRDVDPAPLPPWLVDALTSPQRPSSVEGEHLPRGLDALPDVIRSGQRHNELVRYAGSLRARNVPPTEAKVLFRQAWERCEQPPDDPMGWEVALEKLHDVYSRYDINPAYADLTLIEAPGGKYEETFALDVEREARWLRVREAARTKVAAEKNAAEELPPFDAGLLGDILARPEEPPYRVEGLIPSDAGTLVVAQRKTGKTTLLLNLARVLIIGGTFLGRFSVRPVTGRVGFLNFEVSAAQLARWAADHHLPSDRLYLVNLRGRRNPLTLDVDRDALAENLRDHDVESLIVDPFGRAYKGKSQNDPGEVGAWLADLDRYARSEAGVRDLILAAHAGWNGERTRGASALEDWADVIVTVTRDADDDRFLRAEGRDVTVEEDRLDYDAATRALSLAGVGSRKATANVRHLETLLPAVVELVTNRPGRTGYGIEQALRDGGHAFQKGDGSKVARMAVERGLLDSTSGRRNSVMYLPITTTSPTSP